MTEDLVCFICTQTAKCKNRKWRAISWPDSLTSQRPHSKVSIWCQIYHVLCTDLLSTTLDHVQNQCSLLHCWYLRPYFWSPFENYSQTWSLKHTLLPLDWIPALLVTLPASHSCPTQSLLGFMCVKARMECACSEIVQWDCSVHPAPGFIASICFLWASPSCSKITVEHLGKASAWFRSHSTPSATPSLSIPPLRLSVMCCISHKHIPW